MNPFKAAIVFPGQGAQYHGMGKHFYENYSVSRKVFEEAEDLLHMDIASLCFGVGEQSLYGIKNTQLAVFVVSVAMAKAFFYENRWTPIAFAGHSLGEYCALVCGGALTFRDALGLVECRGRLMQRVSQKKEGNMCAVSGAAYSFLQEECCAISNETGLVLVLSNINSTEQIVVSGEKQAVEELVNRIHKRGYRYHMLKVEGAFHSPLMEEVLGEFTGLMASVDIQMPNVNVISNVSAMPYQSVNDIRKGMCEQIVKPILWRDTMVTMQKSSLDLLVEIGPRHTLRNFWKHDMPDIPAFSFDEEADRKKLASWVSKRPGVVTKHIVEEFLANCLLYAVSTQNIGGSADKYSQIVIPAYRKIEKLLLQLEQNKVDWSVHLMQQSWKDICQIIQIKNPAEFDTPRWCEMAERLWEYAGK